MISMEITSNKALVFRQGGILLESEGDHLKPLILWQNYMLLVNESLGFSGVFEGPFRIQSLVLQERKPFQ